MTNIELCIPFLSEFSLFFVVGSIGGVLAALGSY
jgi:hypothetical protein